jgi:predicted transcriptional regulator
MIETHLTGYSTNIDLHNRIISVVAKLEPVNTRLIAKNVGITWQAAYNSLLMMEVAGRVEKIKHKRAYWKVKSTSDSVEFTTSQKSILTILYNAQKPLTTADIAKRAGIAWVTAKKYLSQMCTDDVLRTGRKGKTVYWWIRV